MGDDFEMPRGATVESLAALPGTALGEAGVRIEFGEVREYWSAWCLSKAAQQAAFRLRPNSHSASGGVVTAADRGPRRVGLLAPYQAECWGGKGRLASVEFVCFGDGGILRFL